MSHLSANIAPPISQQLFANPNSEAALKTSVKRIGCNHKLRAKMKKIIRLVRALFLCAAALTSCQVHEEPESLSFDVEFTATAPGAAQSRAAVQSDGKSVWWEPGDAITVYREDGTEAVFRTDIESPASSVVFSGAFSSPLSEGETVTAASAYWKENRPDGTLHFDIPNEQKAREGSFDKAAFPMVAKSNSKELNFKSVCGGIKFSVTQDDIKEVIIESVDEEGICRGVSAEFTEEGINVCADGAYRKISLKKQDGSCLTPGEIYYAVMIPGTLKHGFRITLVSESKGFGIYTDTAQREIKRAIFGSLMQLDKHINNWSKEISSLNAIDLGLPSGTLWASSNLGADNPENLGFYYEWGETLPRIISGNYLWLDENGKLTKYNLTESEGVVDNRLFLLPEDDAAHAATSGMWQIPSSENWKELNDHTTFTWCQRGSNNGALLTSTINGESIFLPASGLLLDNIRELGTTGEYLSCDLNPTGCQSSIIFYFNESGRELSTEHRFIGMQIRPVHYSSDRVRVSGLTLNDSEVNLRVGDAYTLIASVLPEDAYNKTVLWSSSDTNIASVDDTGAVSARSKGQAVITAKTLDGGFEASCTVNVSIPVSSITLNTTELNLQAGESYKLEATIQPAESDSTTLTWTSSDESIAVVSSDGLVTAVADGSAIIRVEDSDSGAYAECQVNVKTAVTKVSITPLFAHMRVGQTLTFKADVYPENATDKRVSWKSSNNSIVSVDPDGNAVAKGRGSAKITVTTQDGNYSASSSVEVTVGVDDIQISESSLSMLPGQIIHLTLTFSPSDADNRLADAESSAESIVKGIYNNVKKAAEIQALQPGSADVVFTSRDGGHTAVCHVEVSPFAIPEFVDLGLPSGIRWATFNLGAKSPEDQGSLYAWGSTWIRDDRSWDNCPYCDGNYTSKYDSDDNKYTLESTDDAATVRLGSNWRIPKAAEALELLNTDYCEWTRTSMGGAQGYQIKSKKNGKSIFLPDIENISDGGTYYWTSSVYSNDNYGRCYNGAGLSTAYRYKGMAIRPVYDDGSTPATAVTLDRNKVYLIPGESTTLTATVSPDNARDKSITWSSSNESIVSVNDNGEVTAISTGTANIKATSESTGIYTSCKIIVGPEAIDLGLPSGLKWGSCNVDATAPEQKGSYQAWAAKPGRYGWAWEYYIYVSNDGKKIDKYNTESEYGKVDNLTVLTSSDDCATYSYGTAWRTPTKEDYEELVQNSEITNTTVNGISGKLITSKINGHSIFMPLAGGYIASNPDSGAETSFDSEAFAYWTASLHTGWSLKAYSFDGANVWPLYFRYYALPVRPVYAP